MTAQDIAAHDVVSFDDLKLLAGAKPPCLTMLVPLPNPLEIETRLNNALRDARKVLAGRGVDDDFLEPIRSLAGAVETERNWANALMRFGRRTSSATTGCVANGKRPSAWRIVFRLGRCSPLWPGSSGFICWR